MNLRSYPSVFSSFQMGNGGLLILCSHNGCTSEKGRIHTAKSKGMPALLIIQIQDSVKSEEYFYKNWVACRTDLIRRDHSLWQKKCTRIRYAKKKKKILRSRLLKALRQIININVCVCTHTCVCVCMCNI